MTSVTEHNILVKLSENLFILVSLKELSTYLITASIKK